jgi:hypothetical protein
MHNKQSSTFRKLIGVSFLAFALMAITHVSYAQEPGVRIGIKGGVNLSTLSVDEVNAENAKLDFHGGIFSRIAITDFFSIQPEILYTSRGSRLDYEGIEVGDFQLIQDGEVRFNLNYVDVPILAVINLGAFNIHGGVYGGYLVNANVRNLTFEDLQVEQSEPQNFNVNNFNRFDYGLVGGIGVNSRVVYAGLRYNYGLREIAQGGVAGAVTAGSRNSFAQLYLGIALGN